MLSKNQTKKQQNICMPANIFLIEQTKKSKQDQIIEFYENSITILRSIILKY